MYLRTVQCVGINFKTDASVFPDEIDHAPFPQKGLVLPDQKHARLIQALYGGLGMLPPGRPKENDAARFHVLLRAHRLDPHQTSSNNFSGDDDLQDIKKILIPAADSDH